MSKRNLIYGVVTMMLIVSLFVLTGCTNNAEKNTEVNAGQEETQAEISTTEKKENSNDEKILNDVFSKYGLVGKDLMPNFTYNNVVKDEKAEGAAYIVLNDELLTEEELNNYFNKLIDACIKAADGGLVYEMRGEEILEKDSDEAKFGVYIYKRDGVSYRFSCDEPQVVGEPIMLTVTTVK